MTYLARQLATAAGISNNALATYLAMDAIYLKLVEYNITDAYDHLINIVQYNKCLDYIIQQKKSQH